MVLDELRELVEWKLKNYHHPSVVQYGDVDFSLGMSVEDIFEVRRRNPAQLKRCVNAIVSKGGDVSRDSVSKAFAICTASLQNKGYIEKGTNVPTEKGKSASKSKAADKTHPSKMKDYEAILAAVRKKK